MDGGGCELRARAGVWRGAVPRPPYQKNYFAFRKARTILTRERARGACPTPLHPRQVLSAMVPIHRVAPRLLVGVKPIFEFDEALGDNIWLHGTCWPGWHQLRRAASTAISRWSR